MKYALYDGKLLLLNCFTVNIDIGVLQQAQIFTTLRIVYVAKGSLSWLIGSKTYYLQAGDIVLLNSYTSRNVLNKPNSTGATLEVYEFLPNAVGDFFNCLDIFYSFNANSSLDCVIYSDNKQSQKIVQNLVSIKNELSKKGAFYKEQARSLLISTLILINKVYPVGVKTCDYNKVNAAYMAQITAFIRNNLSLDLSLMQLSKKFNISASNLSVLFKRYNGLPLNEYIRKLRIENVLSLIKNSKMSILDAAMQSGFSSSSGFYKAFKAVTGTSPKHFLYKLAKES